MQELLSLNNIGDKGINTDLAPWELPAEFITNGINFRVYAGNLIAAGGSKLWSTPPENFDAGHLYAISSSADSFWVVPGRSATWVFNGLVWSDITPASGYSSMGQDDELNWTVSSLGQIPILNNPQDFPQYWSPQSADNELQYLNFEPGITWKDKGFTCKVMRSHKTFLFALNFNKN